MQETIGDVCRGIQQELNAALIAIAEWDDVAQKIKWTYALNPLNDKYSRMELSYGYGVAGTVMQTGRPFLCKNRNHLPYEITKYPIVLAEKLQSFVAIPLTSPQIFGAVLLIGYREEHPLPVKEEWEGFRSRILPYLKERRPSHD
ncbi:GAF domain-containing protein [Halobacillus sp. BBL2006]|uniref:GAF domain-containing protein n=1 Tax=Halobacillus sp. BBL2006 TaxID=1543706 RepID=UPI00068CC747|nr:GAF domain-containing protein [Halobacillus sp. BBL2006]